jgi:tellurite resistance protein TehA-like permease
MRHRINQWIQRLIVPGMVITGLILQHLGFGIVKTLSTVAILSAVLLLFATIVDPGPSTRQLWESLRHRNK